MSGRRTSFLVCRLSPLVSCLSPLAPRLSSLASRLSSLVSRLSSLVSRLSSLVSRLSSLVSRLSSLVSRLSSLVSRLSSLVSRLSSLVSRLSSLVSRLSSLASRLSLLVSRLSFPISRLSSLASRSSPLASRLSFLASRLSSLVSRIPCLEPRLASSLFSGLLSQSRPIVPSFCVYSQTKRRMGIREQSSMTLVGNPLAEWMAECAYAAHKSTCVGKRGAARCASLWRIMADFTPRVLVHGASVRFPCVATADRPSWRRSTVSASLSDKWMTGRGGLVKSKHEKKRMVSCD